MLIVPVVFFSIVSGVSNLGDVNSLGRIGGKSLLLYLLSTCIAVSFALFFANIINPGMNSDFNLDSSYEVKSPPSIGNVIINIVPSNPVEALSKGNMLQIIFFCYYIRSNYYKV